MGKKMVTVMDLLSGKKSQKDTRAVKLQRPKLDSTGKKVNALWLTGGGDLLTHKDFCDMVQEATYTPKGKGEEPLCRIWDRENGKMLNLNGSQMDEVYEKVVHPKEQKVFR